MLISPGGVREVHLSSDIAVLEELRKKAEGARSRDSLGVGNHVLLLVVDLVTPTELSSSIVE